jgi:hypothetical protein
MITENSEIRREPTPMPRALTRAAVGAAFLALLLMVPAALSNWNRFIGNWLVLFVFVVTLGLGALFWWRSSFW